ncbi:hypothetical protein [Alteriqipengyuania sp. 357]
MSDLAPDTALAPRADAPGTFDSAAALIEQWAAVEGAAQVLAMLAGRPAPHEDTQASAQIALLARRRSSRGDAATFALCELVATMRVGLDALLAAHGSSASPQTAAARLWTEYEQQRAKVLEEVATALSE